MTVEVFQRQAGQLGLGIAAEPVHGALRNPGHDVGEQPGEGRSEKIHESRQRKDLTELGKVDAATRHDVRSRHQVGDLAVSLSPQGGDRLLLGDAGGQALTDDAVEDHVRRVADDLGPDDAAGDAAQRQDRSDDDAHLLRAKSRQELAQGLAKVFGLLGRQHAAEAATTKPWPPRRSPAGVARHHATASSPSCEATISR